MMVLAMLAAEMAPSPPTELMNRLWAAPLMVSLARSSGVAPVSVMVVLETPPLVTLIDPKTGALSEQVALLVPVQAALLLDFIRAALLTTSSVTVAEALSADASGPAPIVSAPG